MMMSSERPSASAAAKPNRRFAPGFLHRRITPARSAWTMASDALASTASTIRSGGSAGTASSLIARTP